jgi:hypothetical protein
VICASLITHTSTLCDDSVGRCVSRFFPRMHRAFFALQKFFCANKQKVIDRYSQVIYIARRSVMPPTTSACLKFSTMRYCAGKGGIVDGD